VPEWLLGINFGSGTFGGVFGNLESEQLLNSMARQISDRTLFMMNLQTQTVLRAVNHKSGHAARPVPGRRYPKTRGTGLQG
jgi:hypothetical protein